MYKQYVFILMSGILICETSFAGDANLNATQKHSTMLVKNIEIEFEYKNGLLTGEAKNTPIHDVLVAIGRAANLEVEQRYKPDSKESITYRISGMSLQEGLRELFQDYSYLFIPSEQSDVPGKLILLERRYEEKQTQQFPQPNITLSAFEIEPTNEATENKDNAESQRIKIFGPKDLNAFMPLDELAPKPFSYDSSETAAQLREREEQEVRYTEARLQRALAALESDYEHLYEQALSELQDISDPGAIALLFEASTGAFSKSTDLQFFAAEVLSRQAADLGYKNQLANDALKKLQNNRLPAIRDLAGKALDEMQYIVEQEGGTGG